MSVDPSKLKIGDAVTIRARITDLASPHYSHPVLVRVGAPFSNGNRAKPLIGLVAYEEIATHVPAPREFKPGDTVFLPGSSTKYEFIASRDGRAALWFVDERGELRTTSVALSELRLADDPALPNSECTP